MSEDPQTPAAGWYPTPEGEQRFWDGSKWLALPAPGSPDSAVQKPSWRRPPRRVVLVAAAVLLVLAVGGTTLKIANDSRVESEQQAAQQAAQLAAEEAAKVEAERVATVAAEKDAADSAERVRRLLAVSGIESSVETMAQGHADKGTIRGPIISVTCSPVGGGSTDDLTAQTTVFECFAANTDNGDGTMSGYKYNSTMNWETGRYTYGFGAP